jgi:hypothetical protein
LAALAADATCGSSAAIVTESSAPVILIMGGLECGIRVHPIARRPLSPQ